MSQYAYVTVVRNIFYCLPSPEKRRDRVTVEKDVIEHNNPLTHSRQNAPTFINFFFVGLVIEQNTQRDEVYNFW